MAVFPMADTVFFPGTVLPLRLVTAPERRLVQAVMDEPGRLLAIPMLSTDGSLRRICGAGAIVHFQESARGELDILVHGLHRVRLMRKLPGKTGPFPRYAVQLIPPPSATSILDAQEELGRLQSCIWNLGQVAARQDAQIIEILRSTDDPVGLADVLCATLVRGPDARQMLLDTVVLKDRLASLVDSLAELMVTLECTSANN